MRLPVEMPLVPGGREVSAPRPWWLLTVTPCLMAAAPAHSPPLISQPVICHGVPPHTWALTGAVPGQCWHLQRLQHLPVLDPQTVCQQKLFHHPCLGHRPFHGSTSTVEGQCSGSPALGLTGHRLPIKGPRLLPTSPLRVTYVSLCGLFVHRWYLLLGVTVQCVVGHPLGWCTWRSSCSPMAF